MFRLTFPLLVGLALAALSPSPASADSWMFAPSYYSHGTAAPVRIGPQARGGPYYTRQRGEYIRSGYRRLNSTLWLGDGTYDNVQVHESWVQFGAQY